MQKSKGQLKRWVYFQITIAHGAGNNHKKSLSIITCSKTYIAEDKLKVHFNVLKWPSLKTR